MILGRTSFNYVRDENTTAITRYKHIQTTCWVIIAGALLLTVATLAARSFDSDMSHVQVSK